MAETNNTSVFTGANAQTATQINQGTLEIILQKLAKLDKLENIETLIQNSIKSQNSRIANLESENKKLNTKVQQIQRDNEMILKELRERNIIICGIQDDADETDEDLVNAINRVMPETDDDNEITIESFYRIGPYKADRNRPIRVKFQKLSDRNLVYYNRNEIDPSIYVKEDLPYSMRRDHAALHEKKKELVDLGASVSINFKQRTVETDTGEIYKAIDGKIHDVRAPKRSSKNHDPELPIPPVFERLINKRKRVKYMSNPNFLGKESLRNRNRLDSSSSTHAAMDLEEPEDLHQ